MAKIDDRGYFWSKENAISKRLQQTEDPISKFLRREDDFHVPWISVVVAGIFVAFAYFNFPQAPKGAKNVFITSCCNVNCKFYQFLLDLVGVCIVIPWAVLCRTYLVFRKALKESNRDTVPEAESPFQPWLAYWGLFWSTMVGINPPLSSTNSISYLLGIQGSSGCSFYVLVTIGPIVGPAAGFFFGDISIFGSFGFIEIVYWRERF